MSSTEKPMSHQSELLDRLVGLSLAICTDLHRQNLVKDASASRDLDLIRRRAASEGLGFFTKTLPRLGKDVISALKGNILDTPNFKTFKRGKLPHFLKDVFLGVFSDKGELLPDYDISCLADIIQLTMLFYKLEVPYDKELEQAKIASFIKNDASLPSDFDHLGTPDVRLDAAVLEKSRVLINRLFSGFDPSRIRPRHGPGAVATYEEMHQKYDFKRIFKAAEELYPFTEYFTLGGYDLFDNWDKYWNLTHCDKSRSRMALVPKDSRGPRIISIEPLEMMFLQQGLSRELVNRINSHPLTKGRVNFKKQAINGRLALEGSKSRYWATIDLKDASDRVSVAVVNELFKETSLLSHLRALRSEEILLPNGEVIPLKKFSSMGSALTFPIESTVFWALVVSMIHIHCDVRLNEALKLVYVYGDDIIVPTAYAKAVISSMHYYGLRVNKAKCCYTGPFRESCGVDAVDGVNITPLKITAVPIKSKKTNALPGRTVLSYVSYSNALWARGYYAASAFCESIVEENWGKLPIQRVCSTAGIVDTSDYDDNFTQVVPSWISRTPVCLSKQPCKLRWNMELQRVEYNTLVVRSVGYRTNPLIKAEESSDFLTPKGEVVSKRVMLRAHADSWSDIRRSFDTAYMVRPSCYTRRTRVRLKRGSWNPLS